MKNWIIVIGVIAIIGGAYWLGLSHGESKTEVKYLEKEKLIHDTTVVKRTIFRDSPAKIKTVVKYDTVDNIIYVDTNQIAYSDTLVTIDSSRIQVSYFFPPENKFDVWADIRSKIIYRPEIIEVEKPETFWSRFGVSVQTGAGYGWINKKVDIYTGLGVHFRID